ncbi:unnamed protein product [Paramecium sonneborni]|uniref:Uncharacterized protein n=1 Tax=Paramecium sonneborni TaxID=65129 RepID=A0A8S1P8M4_9CILI|nr:unnamed protein product [Paramecium sonneborni]
MAQNHLKQKKALLSLKNAHNDKQEDALSKKRTKIENAINYLLIDAVGWKNHYPFHNDGQQVVHTTFQIKITKKKEKQITYIQDGLILRIEKFHQNINLYLNLDQIQFFQWKGSKENETQSIVKQTGWWNGKTTNLGGICDEFGYKIGQWIEPCETYCSQYQMTYSGTYGKKGQRIGQWIYWYEQERIGGGNYDENGRKTGEWFEIHKSYDQYHQVIIIGQYNKGLKKGKWQVLDGNQIIGEGFYSENGQKIGKWTELSESFSYFTKLIFGGEYKNGLRIGKWLTFYMGTPVCNQYTKQNYDVIGGGFYNKFGLKEGYWVEYYEGGYKYRASFTIAGEYRKGLKNGIWRTIQYMDGKQNIVGGGNYDQNGKKFGKWIEITENGNFSLISQVGVYRQGVKFGQWDTYFLGNNKKIGGGCYNEQGLKSGKWIEQHEQNDVYKKIIYSGEYNQGKKFGYWETVKNENDQIQKIRGGFYNNQGQKIGQWIDLVKENTDELILMYGCYKDGEKNGQFTTFIQSQKQTKTQKIGGGYYIKGIKVGKWIEISEKYRNFDQIFHIGRYCAGINIGIWETSRNYQNAHQIMGFGYYNKFGIKQGKWIDPCRFSTSTNLVYMGQYSKGIKIGIWQFQFQQANKEIIIMDSGTYKDGIKDGKWIEMPPSLGTGRQITDQGCYNNGIKVGIWEKLFVGKPNFFDLLFD